MEQPKNDITAVRDILFEQLRALTPKSSQEEIAVAKLKNELAQTLVNSAKVEVDALRVIGGNGTGFIPPLLNKPQPSGSGTTVHRLEK